MEKIDIFGIKLAVPASEIQKISSILSGMSNVGDLPDMLTVDSNGFITGFRPVNDMVWGDVFYFQNLMVAQRLFKIDEFLRKQGEIE